MSPNQLTRDSGGANSFTNYPAVFGMPFPKSDPYLVGVLGHDKNDGTKNGYRRVTDVTDGSSNTIILAEEAGLTDKWVMGQFDSTDTWGTGAWSNPKTEITIGGCKPADGTQPGPLAMNCRNADELYSFQKGGCNDVFVDGSVHFLRESMKLEFLIALMTRQSARSFPRTHTRRKSNRAGSVSEGLLKTPLLTLPARTFLRTYATAATGSAGTSSRGNSFDPTIVRFRPICTDTGVPFTSTVVLPFRYQPKEPVENSLTSAVSGTPAIVTVSGLAPARKSSREMGQWVFFAIAILHDSRPGRLPGGAA
jgi:Protein of unknown function (DUF1559)